MATPVTLESLKASLKYHCVCTSLHPRSEEVCPGCSAVETGRNCWEMAISPCCDLSRESCDTCMVYAAAMRRMALTERVRMVLDDGTSIEGEVCRAHNERLSDALNDHSKIFVAVTDATIEDGNGGAISAEPQQVILVAKHAIRMAFPLEQVRPLDEMFNERVD